MQIQSRGDYIRLGPGMKIPSWTASSSAAFRWSSFAGAMGSSLVALPQAAAGRHASTMRIMLQQRAMRATSSGTASYEEEVVPPTPVLRGLWLAYER
jgi:hypothetical protein